MSQEQLVLFSHPTRSDVVRVARSCIGTPFKHQGRAIGVGLDCVGLLVAVANELGLTAVDHPAYYRAPDGSLEEKLSDSLWRCERDCIHCHMPGDVLCLRIHNQPQHVAIRTERGIVHALGDSKTVNETSYDDRWRRRLVSIWEWPGLDDVPLLEKAAPTKRQVKKPQGCCD